MNLEKFDRGNLKKVVSTRKSTRGGRRRMRSVAPLKNKGVGDLTFSFKPRIVIRG